MDYPRVIFLVSGKRKSGKDYICEKVKSRLPEEICTLVRISSPLKELYANRHNLDFRELLCDGPYKEKYRLDMINWSDEVRRVNPGYFCEAACQKAPHKPVWVVCDIRRKTDIKWFRETYPGKIKMVRISATDEVRKSRGWVFSEGVDDVQSECDLDSFEEWDLEISNNSSEESEEAINKILETITDTQSI